jgi:hypothetical protein
MQSVQTIGNFVNTRERYALDPYGLHAEMSSHKYAFAQQQILEFFNDSSMESIIIGSSSGDMRSHMLYRSDNGVIYQVHFAYGQYSDAFYLTEEFLKYVFEGNENNIPTFENPAQLSEFGREFYDEETLFEPIPMPPSSST